MKPADGVFLVLVGPDGVGKTSVARALADRTRARYFHFSPPVLREWDQPIPGVVVPAIDAEQSRLSISLLRIGKAWIVFWLGYLVRVRPALKSGFLVIADRWAYGYLAKPVSLRYSGPDWLARAVVRALPQPLLVVSLSVSPTETIRRKPELSVDQATADGLAWSSIPVPQLAIVDANASLDEVVDEIRSLAGLGESGPKSETEESI